jgi:hypothetical protein
MQRVWDEARGGLPAQLQTGRLAPVPKAGAREAPHDLNNYRGICVSSLFSRVLEKLLFRRLDSAVERAGLRAPTQCGFRRGLGTLDAIFALQHCVDRARHERRALVAVFIDFRKAFDLVPRELLLERCAAMGITGPFYDALVAIYDRVTLHVDVGGETGPVFATHQGTKQGSELSPLLFGLFIELLHHLIATRCPGAGPQLESLRVPELLYADDGTLLAWGGDASPPRAGAVATEAQQLLDCLDVFCRLFGMEVNLAPHKTCAVVFHGPGAPRLRGLTLTFRGQEVPRVPSYTYLGALFHETRGLVPAAAALAASGSRAMHALLSQLRRSKP